jgi:hypothetical protein
VFPYQLVNLNQEQSHKPRSGPVTEKKLHSANTEGLLFGGYLPGKQKNPSLRPPRLCGENVILGNNDPLPDLLGSASLIQFFKK